MLHIENFEDGIELYKALGSEVRVEIIKLLVFFIKNIIAVGKFGGAEGVSEYMGTLEGLWNSISSLFTALEEGGEMLIAIFAIIAILQAHALFNRPSAQTT